MRYAKLINGQISYSPQKVEQGNTITYNPPFEVLISMGYKPIEENPMPETEDGFHAEVAWSETDSAIIKEWVVVEDSDEIDELEALAILLGGAS